MYLDSQAFSQWNPRFYAKIYNELCVILQERERKMEKMHVMLKKHRPKTLSSKVNLVYDHDIISINFGVWIFPIFFGFRFLGISRFPNFRFRFFFPVFEFSNNWLLSTYFLFWTVSNIALRSYNLINCQWLTVLNYLLIHNVMK